MRMDPIPCDLASQVGFRDYKAVMKTKVEERVNAIVNRLNATKKEVSQPDLAGEREAYEKQVKSNVSRLLCTILLQPNLFAAVLRLLVVHVHFCLLTTQCSQCT